MRKCLYIASPSYSGSTLLTMLLGSHPDIATVGEMKGGQEDLATYQCSCGSLFARCPFWNELIEKLRRAGFEYNLADRCTMPNFRATHSPWADALLRRGVGGRDVELVRDTLIAILPSARRALDYHLRYNQGFIELVCSMLGRNLFLDSSKDARRIKFLARIPSLELSIVQLIRDGRAVINSARKNAGASAIEAAHEWREAHEETERAAAQHCAGRLLPIRYEDLCLDPGTQISRILAFVSLSGELDASAAGAGALHVLGNRMRLKGTQPIKLDEAWRSELNAADRRDFDRIAGAMNRRFGYSDDEPVAAAEPAASRRIEVVQRA